MECSEQLARLTARITVVYLVATAALIAVFGQALTNRPGLVAAYLGGAVALLLLQRYRSASPIFRFLRDWHPIILFPVLYKEVEPLAAAMGDWRLTQAIPAVEAMLFAGQPSLYLSERLPFVPLSELLHFCYLAHVVVIPSVAGYWYISGRRVAFHELVLLLATVMLGSYFFFILFPVDSPYYLSEPPGPPLAGHFFYDLVHKVSDRGGARGGAFPSAHVSGALVVCLVAWRRHRRLAFALAPVFVGIVFATVYGRFHYVLDTTAGLAIAVAVVSTYRRFSPRGGNPQPGRPARQVVEFQKS